MTILQTLTAIREMGLSARHKDGEYRITIKGNYSPRIKESIAYYTNDSEDAIGTAKCIAKENGIELK
jgi:hypothetical protein